MKKLISSISFATILALMFGVSGVGAATERDPATTGGTGIETEPQVEVIDELEANRGRVSASSTTGDQRERVISYLDSEARSGRVVDIQSLAVTEVNVGQSGTFVAVTSSDETIREVKVLSMADEEDDPRQLVGAVITQDSDSTVQVAVGATPAYGAGIQPNNVTLAWRTCRDLSWDAVNSKKNHNVYDCVEKWKHDQQSWAYNRYTLFSPAKAKSGFFTPRRNELVDATIRTRPWRDYRSRITGGPYDWAPRPTSTCTTYTASLGFGARGVSGSLSIPIRKCDSEISVFPNARKRSMGTDWNGSTSGQVVLEYTFKITTTGTPFYADYVWLEVQNCGIICTPFNSSEYELWTSANW